MEISLYEHRKAVLKFYQDNQDVFKKPEPIDCLLYVCEEFGETIRAFIRAKRANDLRRDPNKITNFKEEVGDMKFMMLATTAEMDQVSWHIKVEQNENLPGIRSLLEVISVVKHVYAALEDAQDAAPLMVMMLRTLPWMPLEEDLLYSTLEKFRLRCEAAREKSSA